jgi:hypothetical protein
MRMNRQPFELLPALHGTNVAFEIGRDLLPGFEALAARVQPIPRCRTVHEITP